MSENINQGYNPDLKTRIRNAWHRLRFQVTGKSSRVRFAEQGQTSIAEEKPLVIDPSENARAADYFIGVIRDPSKYRSYGLTDLINDAGLMIDRRTGFFYASSGVTAALSFTDKAKFLKGRYNLSV